MSCFDERDFAPPAVIVEPRADGGRLLRSPTALGAYPPRVGDWLQRWSEETPDAIFLAEPEAAGWARWTYRSVREAVLSAATWLLERGADAEHPLMLLSDNSVPHAVLQLAAMEVGVPAVPVSPAYSLRSSDHAKLRSIFANVTPAVVYVEQPVAYGRALDALPTNDIEVLSRERFFDEVLPTPVGVAVDGARAKVGPETIAKVLFTSGSTGEPKGVINTQRMLCSNQQAIAQLWRFLEREPPVLVDWLPWNHTFGANHNFNMVLRNGGTLFINDGKPVPSLVERTVRHLKEVSPTLYFDVPRGFDVLLPHLERDEELRDSFFARLRLIFYAGAALPQSSWERLEAVSRTALGREVAMVSAWGATETAPLVTGVHFPIPRAGVIGLPAPGCEVLLLPNGTKLELRVRGPNITPGYWRRPDLTEAAFDGEDFYLIGDAGRLEDPEDPTKGLVFDGRVSEDFKLTTGTWVHVGALRVAAIAACDPLVSDAVVAGHDRDEVGLMIFPNLAACRERTGLDAEASDAEVLRSSELRAAIGEALTAFAGRAAGSSQRVARALILEEEPKIDAGEITDKGYVNQRAVLERRSEQVRRLYDDDDEGVIRIS